MSVSPPKRNNGFPVPAERVLVSQTGSEATSIPKITVFDYSQSEFNQWSTTSVDVCVPPPKGVTVRWINVDGIRNHEVVEHICQCFGLHPLTIEDITTPDQQPKVEILPEYALIIIKMIHHTGPDSRMVSEQVSIVFGKDYVLSFQEIQGDVFDPIRRSITEGSGRVRRGKADYLAYGLVDMIVDFYFSILTEIGEKIEDAQEQLIANPSTEILRDVYDIKRKVIELRRSTWPVREIVLALERDGVQMFEKTTLPYLRDLYDHVIQITDHIEIYREWLASMLDIYLSSITNRLNEVIKFLTVLSTIALPPTVIGSWYGMNFVNQMPELNWPFFYPALMAVMFSMMIVLFIIFKRRHWI
ncbi:MAG: magnesium and cobalt transport protein CorA [Candidatus Thorarchaeota archaeon]|nr:MAG: magnesium and cobalt transport protein CorA [Candidatus Thorarchaeota archaeon]